MNRSLSGRADLLRALASDDPNLGVAMAELLGYQEEQGTGPTPVVLNPELTLDTDSRTETAYVPVNIPFWRLRTFTAVAPVDLPKLPPLANAPIWRERPTTTSNALRLAPERAVLTRLRQDSAIRRESRDVDVDAIVERLGRGRLLDQLPHRQRRAWGSTICIVEDRARRLTPYWRDQDTLINQVLVKMYPLSGVTIARIGDGDAEPLVREPKERKGLPVSPAPGSLVLVLGDLGCLARQGESVRRLWRQWGRQLREQRIPAIALVPMQATAIPPDLARVWTIVPWGSTVGTEADALSPSTADTVQRLLTLLSPTVRLEPGLLRAVRCLLPEGRRDPGLEARVWQAPAIASQHYVAASWRPEQRRAYLARFAEQPESLRRSVLEVIRAWRAELRPAVWFEEIVGLEPQVHQESIDPTDWEDAVRFLTGLADTLEQDRELPTDTAAWIVRLVDRLPVAVGCDPQVQHAVHRLYELVRLHAAKTQAPAWFDPAVGFSPGQPVRQVELWQVADQLVVQTVASSSAGELPLLARGSRLGLVHTANGKVLVASDETKDTNPLVLDLNLQPRLSITIPKEDGFRVGTDCDRLRGSQETRPVWATEIGRDKFGLWVRFEVEGVSQRMRWIPPGRFWMGSPDNEEGRFDWEGPRHEVQLTHGFWLFDTPCTQALWQAVMKKNPSRFKGTEWKERPVEQVSWEDCQKFISTLNAKLPGLALALPTEAEWEYACRAGTETARYAEDLDAIAWYGENSGSETHPVKQRQPNAWGLYDMLGNVDEWCHDGQRSYTTDTVANPLGPTTAGADRVICGGSWGWGARYVRSAYRGADRPGDRYDGLGFRCVSSGQASRLESEPRGDGRRAGVRVVGDRADRRRKTKLGSPEGTQ